MAVRNPTGARQYEPPVVRVGQEDRHAVYQQGALDALQDRFQHFAQVAFGIQLAAKLDQRLAVVVTLAIEKLVDPILGPVLDRIEQQAVTTMAATNPPGPVLGKFLWKSSAVAPTAAKYTAAIVPAAMVYAMPRLKIRSTSISR